MESVRTRSFTMAGLLITALMAFAPSASASEAVASLPVVATAAQAATSMKRVVFSERVRNKFQDFSAAHPKLMSKPVFIAVPFSVLLLTCSDSARTLITKACHKTTLTTLRVLRACAPTKNMKEKLSGIIDRKEASYATRGIKEFDTTSVKSLFDDFKKFVDYVKAANDLQTIMFKQA